jgi:hypothetical protein
VTNEQQIDPPIGPPPAAGLDDAVPVAPERIRDDLLELLPRERREVAQLALGAEPSTADDRVEQGDHQDEADGGAPHHEDDRRRHIGRGS